MMDDTKQERERISSDINRSIQLILLYITRRKVTEKMQVQTEMFVGKKCDTNDLTTPDQVLPLEQQLKVNRIRERVLVLVALLIVSDEKNI